MKVSRLVIIATLFLAIDAFSAEVTVRDLRRGEIPSGVSVVGELVRALTWTDSDGKRLVVFDANAREDGAGRHKDIRVVGYKLEGSVYKEEWRVRDWVRNCPVDLVAYFERDSIEVTDLDRDGLSEISFVYRTACRGGMDFIDQRLVLIEAGKKYIIRGATELKGVSEITGRDIYDGPMVVDKPFNGAPSSFLKYSIKKWNEFRAPRMGGE
ncbi:MAG: hypothetical protein U1E77_19030 [Inhella sp.]